MINKGKASNTMISRKYSLDEALKDPKRIFGSPESVLSDPRLDPRTKLEILEKWRLDAYELSTAEQEGMTGGEPAMLGRVLQAIERLEANNDGRC